MWQLQTRLQVWYRSSSACALKELSTVYTSVKIFYCIDWMFNRCGFWLVNADKIAMQCSVFYTCVDVTLKWHDVASLHVCSCIGSRGVSEVVFPLVDKSATTEAVSMTPLHKTLQSFIASAKLNSKRFFSYLLSTVLNIFAWDVTVHSWLMSDCYYCLLKTVLSVCFSRNTC